MDSCFPCLKLAGLSKINLLRRIRKVFVLTAHTKDKGVGTLQDNLDRLEQQTHQFCLF